MRPGFLIAILICGITICGCAIYQKPRSIHDVSLLTRSQSKIDGEVRVTVAVLSAEESRQLFGVDLNGKGIQPVWVRVQNADALPYWLLSTGLDPDYFSPLESAYAFHGAFSGKTNAKIDEQFRVMAFGNPIVPDASVSGFIFTNRDEGTKVVDIDLIGYRATRYNLTGDPYVTDGYRAVLVFDRWPRSFLEIDKFDWEQPVSNRIERRPTP